MAQLRRVVWVVCFAVNLLVVAPLYGALVDVGVLSFDPFIPSGPASPGVNAFSISNFTGSFDLPPAFPVADALTFQAASLKLFQAGGLGGTFSLGDVGPGFLLDSFGNPVVQVSGSGMFTSAEFIATLFPLAFTLADGTFFTASSSSIDILLSPSSGSDLSPGVDLALISVAGSVQASVPEPASWLLMLTGVASGAPIFRFKRI